MRRAVERRHSRGVAGAEGAPIAGAIAGMLFAVLITIAVASMRHALASPVGDPRQWAGSGIGSLRLAVTLMPFAGLFFLWFIAVSRQHLGAAEDRFFSTVFLASGILFLGLMFVATAATAAVAAVYRADPSGFSDHASYLFARTMITQILHEYALRMSAVFLISQASLWLRTGAMPRWISLPTVPLGLVLLIVGSGYSSVILAFPVWVFLVSAYILTTEVRGRRAAAAPGLAAHGGPAR